MRERSKIALSKRVGIIGGSAPSTTSLEHARQMGQLIAGNGYILVNGGMSGVMEASAKGAKDAGGMVIAILPGLSMDECNPYVDIAVPTGLGHLRNSQIILNSHILVAIDGSYGTLSEIAFAKIHNRTVLGLNTWDIDGVMAMNTPEQVINHIKKHFKNQWPAQSPTIK